MMKSKIIAEANAQMPKEFFSAQECYLKGVEYGVDAAQSLSKEVVEGLTEANLNEPIWDKDYDTIVATRKDAIELIKAKFQL